MFEQGQKDQALLQVFVNTVLGETWTERGEAPSWQRLYERREDYPIGTVPKGGLFLCCGCDVQRDRLEASVTAWGRGKESWLVDHVVLDGDTSRTEVWDRLTDLLNTTYPHESGVRLSIAFRLSVCLGDRLYRPGRFCPYRRRQAHPGFKPVGMQLQYRGQQHIVHHGRRQQAGP